LLCTAQVLLCTAQVLLCTPQVLLCTRTNRMTTQAAAIVKVRGATTFFMADSARVNWPGKALRFTSRPAPAHPVVAAHTTRAGHATCGGGPGDAGR